MSEPLKLCPFCGGYVHTVYINHGMPDQEGNHERYIECPKCDSKYYSHDETTPPTDEWNTRPIEDALKAELDGTHADNDRMTAAIKSICELTFNNHRHDCECTECQVFNIANMMLHTDESIGE